MESSQPPRVTLEVRATADSVRWKKLWDWLIDGKNASPQSAGGPIKKSLSKDLDDAKDHNTKDGKQNAG